MGAFHAKFSGSRRDGTPLAQSGVGKPDAPPPAGVVLTRAARMHGGQTCAGGPPHTIIGGTHRQHDCHVPSELLQRYGRASSGHHIWRMPHTMSGIPIHKRALRDAARDAWPRASVEYDAVIDRMARTWHAREANRARPGVHAPCAACVTVCVAYACYASACTWYALRGAGGCGSRVVLSGVACACYALQLVRTGCACVARQLRQSGLHVPPSRSCNGSVPRCDAHRVVWSIRSGSLASGSHQP